ncbi:hypothetical protein E4U41_002665 [Claviceps citrina]|nr:hypothetical protein E4U41_002665 [Claviceps citrina]
MLSDESQTHAQDAHHPGDENHDPSSIEWAMKAELAGHHERDQASNFSRRELGVTWTNLRVEARSADSAIHENVLSQFNIHKVIGESRLKPPLKRILDNSDGCVKPGEMLLILEDAKRYRGQIVMNSEEEVFFPTLTVGQTMDFCDSTETGLLPPPWCCNSTRGLDASK